MLREIASSPINILLLIAPVSWALAVIAPQSPWVFMTAAASLIPLAGLIGLGTEQLARRAGPALGRIPQRHVRQRRGADHRGRRAAQRTHRAGQGVDHRQHHRQPAAGARPVVFRRRPRPADAEVPSHRRDQHLGDALSRRRRAGHAGGVRPVALRQPQRAAAGDRASEFLERADPDRRLRRQPDLRLHRAARSVPLRRTSASAMAAASRRPPRSPCWPPARC